MYALQQGALAGHGDVALLSALNVEESVQAFVFHSCVNAPGCGLCHASESSQEHREGGEQGSFDHSSWSYCRVGDVLVGGVGLCGVSGFVAVEKRFRSKRMLLRASVCAEGAGRRESRLGRGGGEMKAQLPRGLLSVHQSGPTCPGSQHNMSRLKTTLP